MKVKFTHKTIFPNQSAEVPLRNIKLKNFNPYGKSKVGKTIFFTDILLLLMHMKEVERRKLFPISYGFVAYNSIRRQLYFLREGCMLKCTWWHLGGGKYREMQSCFQEYKTLPNILRNCIYVGPILRLEQKLSTLP